MTPEQAEWVRTHAWPGWMLAIDSDYKGRGCFLYRMCPCQVGYCGACDANDKTEPRHDLCLTRHRGGPIELWQQSISNLDGRRIANVYTIGHHCRWACTCDCWRPAGQIALFGAAA